ncbi:MAG: bifunctional DNA-binding transcriptional regulator/O6-methylguanine-DNA methyltransferase Ada [Gammaproteobacteria bacterium]|nr:bifunctional DNA-binding transcriptional regulator/O6-methylguanine-DNA methyltransferase Ada [Gammaproteobacteria bacterium]
MVMPSEQAMRKAVAARDKTYDGEFFYGVITTGIVCQPSCSSRPARPENIRFFPGLETAIVAGFRPCKRCRPGNGDQRVSRLVNVARHIEEHAEEQLTLASLASIVGLSSSRLQRVFKQAFGVSPKAYQDAIRMRRFKSSLKEGEGITDAIFSSGFGSISRVYGEANRHIGMTPKAYRAGGVGEVITFAFCKTALGFIVMAATDKGICFVQFGDSKESLIASLKDEFPKAEISASPARDAPELDAWAEALNQHISEGAPRPDLPLDMRGTAFQMKVWQFLLSIREGDVLSYGELAERIGKPKAVRAVASACARNRIGVLIPCHRVLRGDGSLGGYRWGLERKRTLLDSERERRAR